MSKKYKDVWGDISAEDQMSQADLLYRIEQGESDIDDLFDTSYGERKAKKKKKDKINKNGMNSKIEKMIVRRSAKNEKANEDKDEFDLLSQVFKGEDAKIEDVAGWDDDSETEVSSTTNSAASESVSDNSIRKIRVITHEKFNRATIDDGVSPFSFNIFPTDDEAAINGVYSEDEAFDYAYDLFIYMLALRHPTALFKEEEFIEKTKNICGYDQTSFVFAAYNGWVYCYLKDSADEEKLFDVLYQKKDDNASLLRCCAHMASMAELTPNCIYLEDNDYLNEYYFSEFNQKDKFMDIFLSDAYTDRIGEIDSYGNVRDGKIRVLELVSFFRKIASMFGTIVDVTGSGYEADGDDGEYGDITDEDWEEIEKIANEESVGDDDKNDSESEPEAAPEEPVAETKSVRMVENTVSESSKGEPAPEESDGEDSDNENENVDSSDLMSDDMELVAPDSEDQSMVINTHMKPSAR